MSRPLTVARHEAAGRIEAVRLGLRWQADDAEERSESRADSSMRWAPGPLLPGTQRLGPFELSLGLDSAGDQAHLEVEVRQAGAGAVHLDAVVLGFRWCPPPCAAVRFLKHGWQSWSFTGGRLLDEAGEPPFPSGAWLRGFHHARGAVPEDRAGWHESDLVSVAATSAAACLAGLLERGQTMGVVYLRREEGGVRLELELLLERPLAPGERVALEPVRLALGRDANLLLEGFADALGEGSGARTGSGFQAGWCSWYQFFHDVREDTFLANLEALAAHRATIPIDVVQLDDGYQRAIGDWLVTNEKFPRGLAPLAEAVRDAGFRPGLWTAPFCVTRESRLFAAHPDWLLRDAVGELHRGLVHPAWSKHGWIYVLDTSRDEVCEHLMRVFAGLAGMGFTYQKLDFLYTVAMKAQGADTQVTRAARLRRGLEAVRRGAGEEAFLLGCGCPLGAAVGLVDGMRIGPDVAPHWQPLAETQIPGLEPTLPSAANSIRNTLARAWMHRRLWLNDPDCLMVRSRGTDLSRQEVTTLAAAIAATGGMVIFSDDVPALSDEELGRLRETLTLAREIDAGGARGRARALDLLSAECPEGAVAATPPTAIVAFVNASETERPVEVDLTALVPGSSQRAPQPLLGAQAVNLPAGGRFAARLAPHESAVLRVPRSSRLAVFCDYDGTFAVQDVGSTIARRFASEQRSVLWERLSRGELSPWQYNMALLDGLELSEEQLDAFLRSVEADPGARDLVAWCEAYDVPFRVLSDGFDRNLDRLQELHGVRFAYDANRLWYERSRWRIAPGHPDPSCPCGTGTCKRGRIRAFRAVHPDTVLVHVGNGRVSDLCAVEAVDVVFAKDTLAEELASRGVDFEPFGTLHDVLAGLESRLGSQV